VVWGGGDALVEIGSHCEIVISMYVYIYLAMCCLDAVAFSSKEKNQGRCGYLILKGNW
jgi:hypothetical protein